LRYTTSAIISSSLGIGSYLLSMNGMYDPDITAIGTQPEYYDFWTQLYSVHRVIDSRIKVTFANTSTSAVVGVLYPSAASTTVGGLSEAMMLPHAQHKATAVLGGAPTSCTLAASGKIDYALSLIATQAPLEYRRKAFSLNNATPPYPTYWLFRLF
jgi:hypothetical protein